MSTVNESGATAVLAESTPTTVPVLELDRPGHVRIGTRPVPAAGALLRVETTGVCGTDHHVVAGRIAVPTPCVLGHEVIGRIERLAPGHGLVAEPGLGVGVGDRVLVGPSVPCGDCDGCRAGGRCHDRPVYGLTLAGDGPTGGFSPLLALVPGTRVFRVPASVPPARAVFAEPMACVLSALHKAYGGAVPAGTDATVLGFGPIGVCAAAAVAASGGTVTVLDFDPARRALATELGFAAPPEPERAPRGTSALVVESAGTPAAFSTGLKLLAWGGTLVEMGNYADLGTVAIKPSEICLRDLRVVGSGETRYEDFPPAIRLVAETPIALEDAITAVHRFDELEDPAALFAGRARGKAMIVFGP